MCALRIVYEQDFALYKYFNYYFLLLYQHNEKHLNPCTAGPDLKSSDELHKELETLPAGTKPRTSHHQSPGRERRGKRKRSTILQRTRKRAIVSQTKRNTGTVLGNF